MKIHVYIYVFIGKGSIHFPSMKTGTCLSRSKQPPQRHRGGRCCSTWRSTQKRHGAADEDAGSPGSTGKHNLASRVMTTMGG